MAETQREDSGAEQRESSGYKLEKPIVQSIMECVEARDTEALDAIIDTLHPADVADILEQISGPERREFLDLYDGDILGEVLSELDEGLREEVINALQPDDLTAAVRELESDDVVDLLEDLEEPQQERILEALPASDRAAVEQALTYPEFSAGRLMQPEVVRAPEHWRVGDAIDYMRSDTAYLPEQFYHVVLVDPMMRPTGYVTLGKLLASPRETPLMEIVEDSFRTVPVDEAEGEVAYAFNQYHLISMPVVDNGGQLVGMITIDDAMVVLDEEAEEDILRLAGVGENRISDRVWDTTKRRFPWLAVNLVTAILASIVISQFEAVIAQVVALAVLMPIVASMGGNAGTQSLTVAVRAIATKDLTGANVWRVVRREVLVGLVNGLFFALAMGIVGLIWFGSMQLGYVLAIAMVVNMVVAGLAGILIPVALEKIGVDPALASGAFVTTVTDVVGFFAFLGLAAIMLL
ncbi:magnesium transporter [Alphaproteobacteria bacterium KMM 3653]|uniref:Magnesium transporter MgtE n=1 Tax=Harenicola maris TaxID=2841044 RepID=A0AAP2G6D7_9RHOB|nr:magnesium transporter [Harenicola maris]